MFAIQDEIARSIAQALRVSLSPQEEETIARQPTENLQAYDYYLRGCSYARRFDLDFALQMFEQAIERLKRAMRAGWINVDWISRDLDLIPLHDDPEFQRLCREGPPKD